MKFLIPLAVLLFSVPSMSATIASTDDEESIYINGAQVAKAIYDEDDKELEIVIMVSSGANITRFKVETKQQADEIIVKLFDSTDTSIIQLEES